jgi:hypothetical protein
MSTLLAVLLLTGSAVDLLAKQRSGAMVVRVNVLRTCSLDTRGSDTARGAVVLTCSRGSGTEAGVYSSVSGQPPINRVIPVPARETTVIASRPTLLAAQASDYNGLEPGARVAAHQVVTLNF